MNPESKIAQVPFLRITVAMVAGIVCAHYFTVPMWVVATSAIVCFVAAWAFLRMTYGWIYVIATIFFASFLLAETHRSHSQIPVGERVMVSFQIQDRPVRTGRWWRTTAIVDQFRCANRLHDASSNVSLRHWRHVQEQIQLYVDTCYSVDIYRNMVGCGYLNRIDTTAGSSYGDLMRARGMYSRMYITRGNLLVSSAHVSKCPRYYAVRLQAIASERFSMLNLPDSLSGVARAMSVGERHEMERDLRDDYSRVGATHLLAVSGLNVGIVFLLINFLLYWLPLFRQGHVLRCAVVVVAIWGYAAMSGLSPSVIRAALMFSAVQIAIGTGSSRYGLNVMLGSAVVMLAIDPNYLFDMSFQLSYAAVLAILCFCPWLCSLAHSNNVVIRLCVAMMAVSIAATIGTAPLVAYYFGNLPIGGVVINPVVIFSAHVIVLGSVAWIIAPWMVLQPVFAAIIGRAVWVQDGVVMWSAAQKWSAVAVSLPLWGVLVCYVILVAGAVAINMRETKKELSLLP